MSRSGFSLNSALWAGIGLGAALCLIDVLVDARVSGELFRDELLSENPYKLGERAIYFLAGLAVGFFVQGLTARMRYLRGNLEESNSKPHLPIDQTE